MYHLAIVSNPFDDSKTAEAIFRLIETIDDMSSDDITVFLPGFTKAEQKTQDSPLDRDKKIAAMEEQNRKLGFPASKTVFHTYCPSSGDMYYNEWDFVKFMLEMGKVCPGFKYRGQSAMVLIPSLNGKILDKQVTSYNLEPLCSSTHETILKFFLISTFDLLRTDNNKHELCLIDKINNLYTELSGCPIETDTTAVTIRLDNRIIQHMHWKEQDDKVFVSYSTDDKEHAKKIKDLLISAGKSVWIAPEGIPANTSHASAIPAALRIVSKVVVLLSHSSVNSPWVPKEVETAITNRKTLIGILDDNFELSDLAENDAMNYYFTGNQVSFRYSDIVNNPHIFDNFIHQLNE